MDLLEAVDKGLFDIVEELLESQDVNRTDSLGRTALHIACSNRATLMAELLLEHGTNVNATTLGGTTPLHCACYNKELSLIELLVDYSADLDAEDNCFMRPLDIAIMVSNGKSDVSIINYLKGEGREKNLLAVCFPLDLVLLLLFSK